MDNNGGKLNVYEDHYFYALGFDANLENWKLNIAIISVIISDSSNLTKNLKRLEKALSQHDDNNVGIIPTIFTQYFSTLKEHPISDLDLDFYPVFLEHHYIIAKRFIQV